MDFVKSFTVEIGDMFYIKHNRSSFTTIDCFLSYENIDKVVNEVSNEVKNLSIRRSISAHSSDDYVRANENLEKRVVIANFYCAEDETTEEGQKDSLDKYCELGDSSKAFYLYKGSLRKWIKEEVENEQENSISRVGVTVFNPDTDNELFKNTLEETIHGERQDSMSPCIRYSLENGITAVWMRDLETQLMGNILEEVELKKINVLFAAHYKRKSGRVPSELLKEMGPDIVIIGGVPSGYLDYGLYDEYNKITQSSAGDIIFDCSQGKVDIYVSSPTYNVTYLKNNYESNRFGCYYIGTLEV